MTAVDAIDVIDLLQWPAMVLTIAAAWFVASTRTNRRNIGFWMFIVSNAMWLVWAVPAHAYALIIVQICTAAMNVRGALKSDSSK